MVPDIIIRFVFIQNSVILKWKIRFCVKINWRLFEIAFSQRKSQKWAKTIK